jgi:ATP-dependent 26S proteasome regulatory subunit
MSAPAAASSRAAQPEILNRFQHLDRLLRDAVARFRELYDTAEGDQAFHGLYISEQEIDTLVERTEKSASGESSAAFLEYCGSLPGIEGLSDYWQLSEFDHAVLMLALAPEVDLRYERIYAYLQDDVTRRKPTVDLALTLLSTDPSNRIENRKRFAAGAPLLQSGLLRLAGDPAQAESPLLAQYLKLDDAATRMLLGDAALDPRLASFCEVAFDVASPELTTSELANDVLRRIPSFAANVRKQGRQVRLLLSGPPASSKSTAAQAVAATLKAPLLTARLDLHPAWRSEPAAVAALITREASRTGAVLHLQGLDGPVDPVTLAPFMEGILQYTGTVIVASGSTAVAAALAGARFLSIAFPIPDYEARRGLWQARIASAGIFADATTVSTLANHFVHTAEQIATAVDSAGQRLEWRATANQRPSPADAIDELMQAAREQSGAELASLTNQLRPVYSWSDIVLPEDSIDQLKEICQRVAYSHNVLEQGGFGKKLSAGKGVAVLFAGPSGTGKTMAAEVIANALGLGLYRIDLSTVVSKYIGETEKNLERIFNAATLSNSVLLFDEADALCGKRSEVRDAHDRYANIEISYLLQKMEQYEGITILTTNLRGNLDDAFVRRLAFTVHFPFPGESDRLRIWKQIWPEQTPIDPNLNFEAVAKRFKLSGGNIKNVALAAAFLAAGESRPVNMSDLLHSTRREYEKVGKVLSTEELEAAVR